MTAEIIQFGNSSIFREKRGTLSRVEDASEALWRGRSRSRQPMMTTARNRQLRRERGEVWRNADAITDYWNTLHKFHLAVSRAVRSGFREACLHGLNLSEEARRDIVASYREALRAQIFTPAPDVAAVNWKRTHLEQASYAGASKERMEQIIADDVSFLKAHPTRALSAS